MIPSDYESHTPGGPAMLSGKQFLILFLLLAGAQAATVILTPRVMPTKWEYRTYYLKTGEDGLFYGAPLKKMGKEGWEVVDVLPAGPYEHICYLKRPVLIGGGNDD